MGMGGPWPCVKLHMEVSGCGGKLWGALSPLLCSELQCPGHWVLHWFQWVSGHMTTSSFKKEKCVLSQLRGDLNLKSRCRKVALPWILARGWEGGRGDSFGSSSSR